MTTLRAYDLLGRRIGQVTTDCWHAWSSLADSLADRFDVPVDLVEIDCREDGVEYVTVDGQIRGYVMMVFADQKEVGVRPWEADTPEPVIIPPLAANDNCSINVAAAMAKFDALIADIRKAVEG